MNHSSFIDRLFPPRYDFYAMLFKQTNLTAKSITAFSHWLDNPSMETYYCFQHLLDEVDSDRMLLEERLIESFSTPFNREDVYTFSVRLDRIPESIKSALLAIQEYQLPVDDAIRNMAAFLQHGTAELAQGTSLLKCEPHKADDVIKTMRKTYADISHEYRTALSQHFSESDAMTAIKYREVYFEIREAAYAFDLIIDVFHRIIVRLI